MEGTTAQIKSCDNVGVLQLWKYPVPTAHEVKLLLDLFEDYHRIKLGLSFLGIQGMRPTEVPRLRWPWFRFDEEKTRVLEHTHHVYKPSCRKGVAGNQNIWFKEVKKPIYAQWLSDQIIGYAKRAPTYACNKFFPWTTSDILAKIFKDLRKQVANHELGDEYRFLLDQNGYPITNSPNLHYRVHPYSLRRFAITFHYWVTYQRDLVIISKLFGHTKPETTFKHYIMPKEAIGLTDDMIQDGITIDQFIHLAGKKQMRILDFMPDWQQRFLPAGQSTLSDFQPSQ